MSEINDFHAHVYYSEETLEQARVLCEAARDKFGVTMGRMHKQPVGPHPCWSCQLTVDPETIGPFLSWICLNRDGLVLFIHPSTGSDLADHTKHAIWMGQMLPLDLSIFN